MSFTNAPVTRTLVLGVVAMSIAASLLDIKHYFYISVGTHFWRYRQFWRIFSYQLSYANSVEVLFASMTLYNLRSIEQLWGSRKYAVRLVNPPVTRRGLANSSSVIYPRRFTADSRDPPLHPDCSAPAAVVRCH